MNPEQGPSGDEFEENLPETGEYPPLDPVKELEDATKDETDPVKIGKAARKIWQRYHGDPKTTRRIREAEKRIIKEKKKKGG